MKLKIKVNNPQKTAKCIPNILQIITTHIPVARLIMNFTLKKADNDLITFLKIRIYFLLRSLLLATYLSARCPVYFAPAMDLDMYKHPSTSNNIEKLQSYGNKLIPSGFGELASGLIGEGRMAEPLEIVEHIISDLSKDLESGSLTEKKTFPIFFLIISWTQGGVFP